MPIFEDPDRRLVTATKKPEPAESKIVIRKVSEESIRTEFCDGPVHDTPFWTTSPKQAEHGMAGNTSRAHTSDRAELIARIKRGESPTWVPTQALAEDHTRSIGEIAPFPSSSSTISKKISPLFRAAEIEGHTQTNNDTLQPRTSSPLHIQRPSSALHAGDFTEDSKEGKERQQGSPPKSGHLPHTSLNGPLGTSPTTPWYSPSTSLNQFATGPQIPFSERTLNASEQGIFRSRAPSLNSYPSSYILKTPTTPLVQQSNNSDLDFSPINRSVSPSKSSRRHTLPPQALHSLQSSLNGHSPLSSNAARHPPALFRDSTFPYQTHHARRSLTSNWSLQASTSPQTAAHFRPRRLSHSSETSPLQNASMVGSYEESILRGWMSTAPSKPLDFTAQIGVLGKGSCKPKCPAHVIIPFPAVFYSWDSAIGRSHDSADDEPSPYVGHIDLQHSSPPIERAHSGQSCNFDPNVDAGCDFGNLSNTNECDGVTSDLSTMNRRKRRRTSPEPVPPSGGSYRIPQQGQLQIIIKNPNKTAVKLFLVPYDLAGMEVGTKTFIRQRCYSTEPVVDAALFVKPLPDSSISRIVGHDTKRKPSLRYLIHLNICSPSKGRFYLYQHIRVVFANRVPDNKEQLQNDIQVPQPRFSIYKPHRESLLSSHSNAGAKLSAEKAYRRRSSGSGFEASMHNHHFHQLSSASGGTSTHPFSFYSSGGTAIPPIPPIPPIPAIPFDLAVSRQRPERAELVGTDNSGLMDLDTNPPSRPNTSSEDHMPPSSPVTGNQNRFFLPQGSSSLLSTTTTASPSSHKSSENKEYGKLNKGDAGYGGVGFYGRPATPEPGDGLLARRLKGLGVRRGGFGGGEDEA